MASKLVTATAAASVTAPGASTAIADVPASSLPAGWYQIEAHAGYSLGTPAAAEEASGGNIALYVAGTVNALAIPPVIGLSGPFRFEVELDGTSDVSVGSIGAGTAGVEYVAQVACTPSVARHL